MSNFEATAAGGLGGLMEIHPVVSILILVIMGLCWFIKGLLQDARDERKLNRDALIASTVTLTELKELVRNAINR